MALVVADTTYGMARYHESIRELLVQRTGLQKRPWAEHRIEAQNRRSSS